MSGVYHHALNSYKILDYDLCYPAHPGKILAQPPATKGQLTDEQVMQLYISGNSMPLSGPTAIASAVGNAVITSNKQDSWTPDISSLLDLIGSPLQYLVKTQILAFAFRPLVQEDARLTNVEFAPADVAPEAKKTLRADLWELSKTIQAREEKTSQESPKYLLLDPSRLPFYTYI